MYALLLDCCEKYHDNLAGTFPAWCDDNPSVCAGLDYEQFRNAMTFEIPSLFRYSYGAIGKPRECDEYDQYSLLDLIEFVAQNIRDIDQIRVHSYYDHNDITVRKTNWVVKQFQGEINNIFQKTGLQYILTDEMIVERVVENSILTPEVEKAIQAVVEAGTRELLNEAVSLFRMPNPVNQRKAVEKLWDALESLKTHFPGIDGRNVDDKLATKLANGHQEIEAIFRKELSELGRIGNNFGIRHFNHTQTPSTDERHYDYFFNRCMALVATAIQYLQ
jgi:hypothetical protein